jgi:hypothetical protein
MKLPAVLFLSVAIAACNSQSNKGSNQAAGATPQAAPATPPAAQTLRPGRWEMTTRLVSIEMPGATPDMQAQLRAQPIPPPETQANCVTPEEASDLLGNFRQEILRTQPNLSCQIGDQQFGGGRIRFAMNCRGLNGQPDTRMAVVGAFTENNVQMGISAETSMPTGNGATQGARIETTMTGRYVGACNGTETD